MIKKISRQSCISDYPKFPLRSFNIKGDEEEHFYPKVISSFVLTLQTKTFVSHIKLLGVELTALIEFIGSDSLIFLGDTKTSWLYQDNEYKPVKEALKFLMELKVGKRFNGALQVDIESLPVFVKHLSWLTRCNASLPYFHFCDEQQNFIGHICKYGNLHLDPLIKKTDNAIRHFIIESKFEYLLNNNCLNQFGKTSSIKGRKIVV